MIRLDPPAPAAASVLIDTVSWLGVRWCCRLSASSRSCSSEASWLSQPCTAEHTVHSRTQDHRQSATRQCILQHPPSASQPPIYPPAAAAASVSIDTVSWLGVRWCCRLSLSSRSCSSVASWLSQPCTAVRPVSAEAPRKVLPQLMDLGRVRGLTSSSSLPCNNHEAQARLAVSSRVLAV